MKGILVWHDYAPARIVNVSLVTLRDAEFKQCCIRHIHSTWLPVTSYFGNLGEHLHGKRFQDDNPKERE